MRTELAVDISERDFQDVVIEYARIMGWRIAHFRPARTAHGYRTPMQGDKGFPDLVLARKGRVVFAELKSKRGPVQHDQKAWLEELAPPGQIADVDVFLWRPSDFETIKKVLGR